MGRLLDGGLVDYVAMDYKAPLSRYPEICGAGADGFLETLGLLQASEIEWELRTTVLPELREEESCGRWRRTCRLLPLYALQLYRPVRIEKLRVYNAAGYWADSGSAEGSPAQCDCTVLNGKVNDSSFAFLADK